jgi:hypothetical protein
MIERLPVAAHDFSFEMKATLRGQDSLSVELSEQKVQPGQVGHVRSG